MGFVMAGNPIVDELEGRVRALLGSKAQYDPVGKKVNPPELEAHLNVTYMPGEVVDHTGAPAPAKRARIKLDARGEIDDITIFETEA